MRKRINILKINFDNLEKKEVEFSISDSIRRGKQISIFTPNPEILLKAYNSPDLIDILNSSELVLPDGIGIVIASRILKTPLKERITGIDTGEFILRYANKHSLRVFLLGGKAGVAEVAAEKLSLKYPSLNVCGTHHGYFEKSGNENKAVIEKINLASPDIVFVCFGFPEQEKWIHKNRALISSVKIYAGLGGSIDVWAGNKRRAPLPIQKAGLEWAWRIMLEPRRIRVIFRIPKFLNMVICQNAKKSN